MAAGHGLNFVETLTSTDIEPIASALVALALVYIVFSLGLRKVKSATNPLVPDDSLTIRNFAELIAEFVLRLGDNTMGKHNRKHLPFLATIFVYIFFMNVMGLVPGFNGPTDGIPGGVLFNLGIALIVYVMYNYWGVKEVGFKNYMKHMLGPVWWLAPLIFAIEIISHALRPIVLSIRLGGNMLADHLVLGIFTDLARDCFFIPFPVIFYFLGLFVCFMQAFIFTILTMVYIALATEHDEEHAH